MFKSPDQLMGQIMTNPNQIKKEQELISNTLLTLTTELIKLKKENDNLKFFSKQTEVTVNNDRDHDENFNLNSLDISNPDTDTKELDNFFENHKLSMDMLLVQLISNKDKLNKSATIGSEPFNMFKSKEDLDKGKHPDVIIGKSKDDTQSIDSSDSKFYNIDFQSKRDLNSHSTDFVTNNFLVNKSKYLHFILSSINLFMDKIKSIDKVEQFLEVDFIMKGGNLLKLFFDKISKDLNSQINDYLQNQFGQNFATSDFDFDIKLKPKENIDLEIYETIRVQISNMLIIYLILLRDVIVDNKEYFFDFYKLNKNAQHNLLRPLLENYNKGLANIISQDKENKITRKYADLEGAKITSIIYDYDKNTREYLSYTKPNPLNSVPTLSFVKNDFNIINDNEIEDKIINVERNFYLLKNENYLNRLNINSSDLTDSINLIKQSVKSANNKFLYNTSNININFGQARFSLFRIKVNFIGEITFRDNTKKFIQIPGELLDISLAKKDDQKLLGAKPHFYTQIEIKNINKTLTVQSHDGLTNEIIVIIFNETKNKPWIDIKYKKRIIRLVILSVLRILYGYDKINFIEKIKLCEILYKNINNNFINNLELNSNQSLIFQDIFGLFYSRLKSTYETNGTDAEYKTFKQIVIELFNKMINVLKLHYQLSLKKGNMYKIEYLDGFK